MILCNSSDRIKRQLKVEKRKRTIRKMINIFTLPLKLRFAIPLTRSGKRKTPSENPTGVEKNLPTS